MDSSKYRSRGYTMGSSNKRLALLLLLALGAAALSVVILHKMRERRVFALLLQERNQQLMSLQIILEKEKALRKEMRWKVEDLKAKTSVLRNERMELKNKLEEAENTAVDLKNTQKELEAAMIAKESRISEMQEKAADSSHDQVASLTELLKQKEAELEEMKIRFSEFKKAEENTTSRESDPADASNGNGTSGILVLEKYVNSSDAAPARTEENNSTDAIATESSSQEGSTTEVPWLKFTTNLEDDGLQDKTTDDASESSDGVAGESHPENVEVPRRNNRVARSRKVRREELDDTAQLEEHQDQVTGHSIDSKLLGKEDGKAVYVNETEKEISTDGEPEKEISKDSISEANQKGRQAVQGMVDPSDEKHNKTEGKIKRSKKRRMRRKFRSNKMKMPEIDAANVEDAGTTSP